MSWNFTQKQRSEYESICTDQNPYWRCTRSCAAVANDKPDHRSIYDLGPYDAVAVVDASDLGAIGYLVASVIQPIEGVELNADLSGGGHVSARLIFVDLLLFRNLNRTSRSLRACG